MTVSSGARNLSLVKTSSSASGRIAQLLLPRGVTDRGSTPRSAELWDIRAWMEAWPEVDAAGFRYYIVSEGGSAYIGNRVLKAALERERALWNGSLSERSNLTTANYDFIAAGLNASELMRVTVKPKRQDELLINGVIILTPDTGDLLRVEGHLAKLPSFWTSRIEVVRTYDRIDGVRVPVHTESLAQVKMAGASSFAMSYEYETINGRRVGSPSVVARHTP